MRGHGRPNQPTAEQLRPHKGGGHRVGIYARGHLCLQAQMETAEQLRPHRGGGGEGEEGGGGARAGKRALWRAGAGGDLLQALEFKLS